MKTLVWSNTFVRAFKRALRRRPNIRIKIEQALNLLATDPFNPILRTHKLKGKLTGVWACMVDYDYRILFEFVKNPETGEDEILLLTLGTHDEVY